MKYGRPNPLTIRAHVLLVGLEHNDDEIERVVSALQSVMRNVNSNLEDPKSKDNPYYDDLVAGEAYYLDALIGTAFVVLQTYLARISSEVLGVHKFFPLTALANSARHDKHEVFKMAFLRAGKTEFSLPEAVDGLANYFKHKDEGQPHPNTEHILKSLGIEDRQSIPLLEGLGALGYADVNITSLYRDLEAWKMRLYQTCRAAYKTCLEAERVKRN